MPQDWQIVRTEADISRWDGQRVLVIGEYEAIPNPVKGMMKRDRPKDRAVVKLSDGTLLYLEPLDSAHSRRESSELEAFDQRMVRVLGTVHAQMPSKGESLIAPCITDIELIEEERRS